MFCLEAGAIVLEFLNILMSFGGVLRGKLVGLVILRLTFLFRSLFTVV